MIVEAFSVVAPLFFTLFLGYIAGRAKRFDSNQVAGINELVLDYALPAALFAGAARTSRAALLQQGPLFLSLLLSVVGMYAIAFVVARFLFRHDVTSAAIQAVSIAFGAALFMGPAVLSGLYGPASAVAVAMISIILNVIVVPTTLVLIDLSRSPPSDRAVGPVLSLALIRALRAPFVWAPLIAIALVFVGVPIPAIVLSSISLIGVATSGVALFVAGTSIAAHQVMLNTEVFANCALKMVAQPALFFVLATIFRVIQPYASEGFLLTLLPSGPVSLLLAVRYKAYISEAGSTLAFTAIALLVTLPVGIYLVGAK